MPVKPLTTLLALKALALAPGLTDSERIVGCALVEHFNRRTSQCDPGLQRLAKLTGLSARTVIRATNRLDRLGLVRKQRHGGHLNRNSYEPVWERLQEVLDAWDGRFRRKTDDSVTSASPAHRHGCHHPRDNDVTRTCSTNLHQSTCSSGLSKKHVDGDQATAIDNAIGKGSVAAGRDQAERRWIEELNARFSSLPITYAEIIEAITEQIRDAATDAELQRCGAGISYLTKQLKLG